MPGVLECLTVPLPRQYYIVRVRDQDLNTTSRIIQLKPKSGKIA